MKCKEDDSILSKEMKRAIAQDLESRYCNPSIVVFLDKCTYLDPRFMDRHVSDKPLTKLTIKEEMEEIDAIVIHPDSEVAQIEIPQSKRSKGLGAILREVVSTDEPLVEHTIAEQVQYEMERYEAMSRPSADSDPLQWWKVNAANFPRLSILAKKYLCTCGTSVPSERLFSRSGHISHGRSRISPDILNKLVFLSKNLP